MTAKDRYRNWFSWRVRQCVGMLSCFLPNRPRPIKRILCILSGGLGDRLMVLPALRFLRRKYPNAYMCVAWFDGGLPVVDAEFDEVITFPVGTLLQKIRMARRGYDLCFVSTLGIQNALTEVCTLVSGASMRMGPISVHVDPRKGVYNHPYVLDGEKHETVLNCAGAGWSGTEDVLAYPLHIDVPQVHQDGHGTSCRRTRLGLHIGCKQGYEMKRWSPDRYRSLIRLLNQKGSFEFALLGDCTEKVLMEETAQGCDRASVQVLANLDDFITQIRQCDVFVGNDSGLCHLAAALDVPTVVIMGPTDPKLCRPVFSKGKVIQAPCKEKFCFYSGTRCQRCLDTIPAEEVAKVIESLHRGRQQTRKRRAAASQHCDTVL